MRWTDRIPMPLAPAAWRRRAGMGLRMVLGMTLGSAGLVAAAFALSCAGSGSAPAPAEPAPVEIDWPDAAPQPEAATHAPGPAGDKTK